MISALILTGAMLLNPVNPVPIVAGKTPAMTGAQPSAYHGKFYSKPIEKKRLCIGQREGRFQYWGTGSNGLYQGTYQVTKELAIGAAWMMRKELRDMWGHTVGTEISRMLRVTPAHKWNRFYQDMMFFTIANWQHEGSGLKHWRGGRYAC
jgi:hypothetical protein